MKVRDEKRRVGAIRDSILFSKKNRPALIFNSGKTDYTYYFRSNIDTPLLQHNIYQHQLNGTASVTIANQYPLRINTQIRRSNSVLFRDINDVQVEFDLYTFRQKLFENAANDIRKTADLLSDTLTKKRSELKHAEYLKLEQQFSRKYSLQELIQANEILHVPELSWDYSLSDSAAQLRSDSIKRKAADYIEAYRRAAAHVEETRALADSLQAAYAGSVASLGRLKQLANGKINNYAQLQELQDSLKKRGGKGLQLKNQWLLGIRRFSVGRSPLNYSELTAKNISVNGLNFEYNSWYYFSVSAGLIDFRYRDFLINNASKPKQHFFMGRLGLGNTDKNFIVLSLFKGKKQVYGSGINDLYAFETVGASIEAGYRIGRHIRIKGEIAESKAPDFHNNPPKNPKWNLKDKTDKAVGREMCYYRPIQRSIYQTA